jgi:hypothetical protein
MKKTNKILSTIVAVALSSSVVNASEIKSSVKDYFTFTKASYKLDSPTYALKSDVELQNTVYDELDYTGLNIGRIVKKESGLVLGSSANFFSVGQDSWGIGVDVRVGYAPINDLSVYGIVGYNMMFLTDYTMAKGLNTGVGITYDISENFAFVSEYKTYNLTVSTDDRADTTNKAKGLSVGLALAF